MAESELKTRRGEHDKERKELFDKLHEIEREKAFLKAQDSNILEKLANLKADKEKYEKLYHEAVENHKKREEKLEKDHKERVTQLENRLDQMRNQSSTNYSDLDKKLALMEQELTFTKRENQNLKGKTERYEEERMKFNIELRQRDELIEERKKKILELENSKSMDLTTMRSEIEKKFIDVSCWVEEVDERFFQIRTNS